MPAIMHDVSSNHSDNSHGMLLASRVIAGTACCRWQAACYSHPASLLAFSVVAGIKCDCWHRMLLLASRIVGASIGTLQSMFDLVGYESL